MTKPTNEIANTTPPAQAVLHWLLTGASEHDVAEALRAKYPKADPAKTLHAVRERLAAEGCPDADALRGWCLMSYRELYRRMLEIGDFDGARKVIKNITDLSL